MSRCTKTDGYITEIEQCIREGRAWCPCVADDLPKARAARDAGNCSKARYHAIEALKRCTGSAHDISGAGEADKFPTFDVSPIGPVDPMSFILNG